MGETEDNKPIGILRGVLWLSVWPSVFVVFLGFSSATGLLPIGTSKDSDRLLIVVLVVVTLVVFIAFGLFDGLLTTKVPKRGGIPVRSIWILHSMKFAGWQILILVVILGALAILGLLVYYLTNAL